MIDERTKTIFVDYSTLAVHQACEEKCRLGSVRGWRKPDLKLDFGHAIHAGWAAYYDALAGGWHAVDGKWYAWRDNEMKANLADNAMLSAKAAFLRDMGHRDSGATIPVNVESDERRSLERGQALLEGYFERWKDEPYDNILRADGSPLVEVGFQFYLCQFQEYRVVCVGYIDRIMRNRYSGRPTIVEGKTTTQALPQFIQQVKPNHQISIYFRPANELMEKMGLGVVRECVWDCMFISDRKPNYGKSLTEPLMMYGVDVVKDYARQTTTRSSADVTAVTQDLEESALNYCKSLFSQKTRWKRTAPGACHAYGGCKFRNRCSMNIDEVEELAFMQSEGFTEAKWEPWRKIVEAENGKGTS